ncbi:hypothetical protein SXCC_03069 [Gluconacetobacter sp. SXCC-1]|nr:hypothetical protein SXCC_03069 [Gluconacetobacter sp. SXCC-1]
MSSAFAPSGQAAMLVRCHRGGVNPVGLPPALGPEQETT